MMQNVIIYAQQQFLNKVETKDILFFLSFVQQVAWPSGLRRWFKAPVSSEAWVRIPPLPDTFYQMGFEYGCQNGENNSSHLGIEPRTFGLEVQRAILCANGTAA